MPVEGEGWRMTGHLTEEGRQTGDAGGGERLASGVSNYLSAAGEALNLAKTVFSPGMTEGEGDDLAKTDIFREMAETPCEVSPLARQRDLQAAFDAVLSKLGSRAIAPDEGENDFHYLAKLATQAAMYGPPERREIARLSLPPAALAIVAQQDLANARAEIERPRHSLKPGETREVKKIDRSGRPVTEFYNADNSPDFWMDQFKPPLVSYVSGGSKGICENPGGFYSFDKSHLPEVQRMKRQADYDESPAGIRAKAFREAGLELPKEFGDPPPSEYEEL